MILLPTLFMLTVLVGLGLWRRFGVTPLSASVAGQLRLAASLLALAASFLPQLRSDANPLFLFSTGYVSVLQSVLLGVTLAVGGYSLLANRNDGEDTDLFLTAWLLAGFTLMTNHALLLACAVAGAMAMVRSSLPSERVPHRLVALTVVSLLLWLVILLAFRGGLDLSFLRYHDLAHPLRLHLLLATAAFAFLLMQIWPLVLARLAKSDREGTTTWMAFPMQIMGLAVLLAVLPALDDPDPWPRRLALSTVWLVLCSLSAGVAWLMGLRSRALIGALVSSQVAMAAFGSSREQAQSLLVLLTWLLAAMAWFSRGQADVADTKPGGKALSRLDYLLGGFFVFCLAGLPPVGSLWRVLSGSLGEAPWLLGGFLAMQTLLGMALLHRYAVKPWTGLDGRRRLWLLGMALALVLLALADPFDGATLQAARDGLSG